jgi:pyruvate carboxylase subunit B
MSAVIGKVGKWELEFKRAPHQRAGEVDVQVAGHGLMRVKWRMDQHGIWIESSDGVTGFDIEGEKDEDGAVRYRLLQRGGPLEFNGLSLKRAGEAETASGQGLKKSIRVRSQMPGKIVRVQVKEGDTVQKGDPLLVMEAMKMENEIRATHAGVIKAVKVSVAQAVETGAELILLDTL